MRWAERRTPQAAGPVHRGGPRLRAAATPRRPAGGVMQAAALMLAVGQTPVGARPTLAVRARQTAQRAEAQAVVVRRVATTVPGAPILVFRSACNATKDTHA